MFYTYIIFIGSGPVGFGNPPGLSSCAISQDAIHKTLKASYFTIFMHKANTNNKLKE